MKLKKLVLSVASVVLALSTLVGSAFAEPNNNTQLDANHSPLISNFKAPPSTFDPESASEEDLSLYGFPNRPHKGTEEYRQWKEAVSVKNRVDMVMEPITTDLKFTTTTSNSANYSGYRVTDTGNYTAVIMTSKVPKVTTSKIVTATWAGLADGAGTIIQAGASNGDGTTKSAYFWFENFPDPPQKITSVKANAGDKYYVSITYTSGSTGTLYIANLTTGAYSNGSVSIPHPTHKYAEFILENATSSLGYENVGNYDMTCSYSESSTGIHTLDEANNLTKYVMTNGGVKKYSPTGIGTNGLFTQQGF